MLQLYFQLGKAYLFIFHNWKFIQCLIFMETNSTPPASALQVRKISRMMFLNQRINLGMCQDSSSII